MFKVTYLGHHGWLIESLTTRVLIDPLLVDGIGNMPRDALSVHPPRRIDLAAFPPIDAVVFTHEHADHFSLPSLCRMDRAIPILLSGRASQAARSILAEMGFDVTLLCAGAPVNAGDLEVLPLQAPHSTRDEWDVMPILVRDRAGHGSFLTSVDAPEGAEIVPLVRQHVPRPGVWVYSFNFMDVYVNQEGAHPTQGERATESIAQGFASRYRAQFPRGEGPVLLFVLGCGFGIAGDVSWLNRHAFPGDPGMVAASIGKQLPRQRVAAPFPGQSVTLRDHAVEEEAAGCSLLGPCPNEQWPAHRADPDIPSPAPDYSPACGRTELLPEERGALADVLAELAAHLYGGPIFQRLLAVSDAQFAPRRATLALSLRVPDESPWVFAYDLAGCRFERVGSTSPRDDFVVGLECWATDLLAVLRMEMVSGYLLLGRVRCWNAAPEQVPIDALEAISIFGHPLRHPARALALYRRMLQWLGTQPSARIVLRAGTAHRKHLT
jgi:hypothetical protein